jgi:hypothetical protein
MPEVTNQEIREATCIHTRKIFDSCQAKDCVEGVRFYPTLPTASVLGAATSLKNGKADLLYVMMNVEPVGLGRGFYTVDLRYFYRVTADAVIGCAQTVPVCGLAFFDKRSVLFGSEGAAKTFSSHNSCARLEEDRLPLEDPLPTAVVEAVDPIILSMKLVDVCPPKPGPCGCPGEPTIGEVPAAILSAFDEDIVLDDRGDRRIMLTLGQFSILRLERDTQLLMPVYDYCMPTKECVTDQEEDDPCELFQQVDFPSSDFFPPSTAGEIDPMTRLRKGCCCNS